MRGDTARTATGVVPLGDIFFSIQIFINVDVDTSFMKVSGYERNMCTCPECGCVHVKKKGGEKHVRG
jgi:hypothetical protein